MKKRTIITLVISIISILGASTLVYNALTPNAENYLADSNGSVSSETTTSLTTTELTSSETQMIETELSTVIDSPTNKNAPPETTFSSTTVNTGTTQTIPPTAATQAPQTQAPSTTQAPSARTPAAQGNAPGFTVYDSNDNPVRLSDYLGKPVVLNFWASWCGPCKAEMPDFQSMSNKYSGQGVVFLMINMTDGGRETKQSATAYLNSQGFNFTPLFDTKQNASSAYSISSIPATFFITKGGDISGKNIGQISASNLENGIKKIL